VAADDPHDVLGVPRGASAAAVQAAYRRLAREHHPDAPGGDAGRMRALNAAYAALRDGSPAAPPAPAPAPTPRFGRRGLRRRHVVVALVATAVLVTVLAVLAATGDEVVEPRVATLVAAGMRFDTDHLELGAGVPVEIRLVNRDVGQRHNVAIHRADVVIARGAPVTGPTAVVYDFGPLPAGAYTFRCEVVPDMGGTLRVT
jgi:hypothetical protein